jgi:hypothetical protein
MLTDNHLVVTPAVKRRQCGGFSVHWGGQPFAPITFRMTGALDTIRVYNNSIGKHEEYELPEAAAGSCELVRTIRQKLTLPRIPVT